MIVQNHAPYMENMYCVRVFGGFGSSISISPFFHRLCMCFAASCFFKFSFSATSSTISFSVCVFVCLITLRTLFSTSFCMVSPVISGVVGMVGVC